MPSRRPRTATEAWRDLRAAWAEEYPAADWRDLAETVAPALGRRPSQPELTQWATGSGGKRAPLCAVRGLAQALGVVLSEREGQGLLLRPELPRSKGRLRRPARGGS